MPPYNYTPSYQQGAECKCQSSTSASSTYAAKGFDPSISPEEYSKKFLDFMDNSPTTWHAVDYLRKELESRGFKYVSEREPWDKTVYSNQKLYTTRNGSNIVAFVVGKDWSPSQGASIVGAHIDALTGKVKPISTKDSVDGYELIAAAPYAGAFSDTWWDRDLGIGGRIIAKEKGKIVSKLVRIPYPVARIPTLAPHFGAPANGPFNMETQKTPIIGLTSSFDQEPATDNEKKSALYGKHSLPLLRKLAKYSGVAVEDFLQVELEIFDTQPGNLIGLNRELLSCPRIDDKVCSYTALFGLLESLETTTSSSALSIVALYDNEEVGSLTRQGAGSNLMDSVISRLTAIFGGDNLEDDLQQTLANSFFVSADVTHAVNPNFESIYLENHKPQLNKGITISFDPNGHMTTDAVSTALVEEIARLSDNEVQYFQIRNDSRSGGTIGPTISSRTGIRAIDVGIAQLSMHSIRATIGSKDVWLAVRFFKSYFELWQQVDAQFKLGDL